MSCSIFHKLESRALLTSVLFSSEEALLPPRSHTKSPNTATPLAATATACLKTKKYYDELHPKS